MLYPILDFVEQARSNLENLASGHMFDVATAVLFNDMVHSAEYEHHA